MVITIEFLDGKVITRGDVKKVSVEGGYYTLTLTDGRVRRYLTSTISSIDEDTRQDMPENNGADRKILYG